ncbi:angiopoietin-related protein 2-like [Anneissia japonica]|uniref:angiopoietin-related protein 2-like n=1 Tax=Anneissia japonica TaxID=1529436 RepID=UPI0014255621|nr:angiopoietin-related protein 2-like [Anneissia japonica]
MEYTHILVIFVVIVKTIASPVGQDASTSSGCPAVNQTCNTMIKELESVRIMLDANEKKCDCGVLSDAQKAIAAQDQLLRSNDCPEFPAPVDCAEMKQRNPKAISGPYYIKPRGYHRKFRVYCDMFTDGGGWTVFQRRMDGSVVFNRTWNYYKEGFGSVMGEHWLGNDYLYYLTRQTDYTLRIDMEDWHDVKTYAKYSEFYIKGESDNYRVNYGIYLSGTATDRFAYHKKQQFTTFDRDNDRYSYGNCAARHSGGWWFNSCDECNLNGKYYHSNTYTGSFDNGIEWENGSTDFTPGRIFYSLKVAEMKVRPTFY